MILTSYSAFIEWTLSELATKPIPLAAIDYVLARGFHPAHGFQLEFGVYSGTTINRIAEADYSRTVWGFDSFRGLPETWRPGFPAGAFDTGGRLPKVRPNVVLVPGWFNETLPVFCQQFLQAGKVSLLHVDCDIYASAKTVLLGLGSAIVPGTIVVFDELINYPGFEDHELKALFEFCQESKLRIEYLGCPGDATYFAKTGVDNSLYQQVAARFV